MAWSKSAREHAAASRKGHRRLSRKANAKLHIAEKKSTGVVTHHSTITHHKRRKKA